MKRLYLVWISAVILFLSGTINVWAQYPDPFLSKEEWPDFSQWIAPPPSYTGGDFANDFYYYQWGIEQRKNAEVSALAISDESADVVSVFSEAIGFTLSNEETPEIALLCRRAIQDAHFSNTSLKDSIKRLRPFVIFNQPSLIPENDEEESGTWSYPSGHSSRGYMCAFVLCNVAPSRTAAIMKRAKTYALNRVICGHHWKSDTDTSVLLSAGLFSMIISKEEYQEQLAKAREEYKQIISGQTAVRGVTRTKEGIAEIYDMQGRRLDGDAVRPGIYISKGRKIIRK